MWRLGVRQLLAKKFRLLSTTIAVLLGVAFLAGSLVLVDTIGKTFDDLFVEIGEGVDVHLRSSEAVDSGFGEIRGTIDAGLISRLEVIEGVAAAQGFNQGYAQFVDRNGDAIGNPGNGPPTFGTTWSVVEEVNPMRLVGEESRPPGPGEVVVDRGTAKSGGFAVGDRVTILLEGPPEEFVISGIATFGAADSALGASMALFDEATAQRVLGEPGRYDGIDVVAAEGVDAEELRDRVDEALPDEVEVITGEALIEENQDAVADALSFFNTFMVVFAVVALLVGAFIIYNTFSILVAQRAKEMALLRALGATSRQILTSVQIEALLVGVVASAVGVVSGLGVAIGLKSLLEGFGIDIPTGGVSVTARTVVVSMVVGILVTNVSAIAPALRAARTPPMAAMRASAIDVSGHSRLRAASGFAVLAAGVGAILVGLFGDIDNALALTGLGALLVFLGVAALGPILARPVAVALSLPLRRLRGFPGLLAGENAQRNPKRTSATASALMIGVGLVGFITIFAASAKSSINQLIDDSFVGDLVIDSGSFGFGGISPELAATLNELPEVEAASGVRLGFVEVDGSSEIVYGVDPATMGDIVDVGVIEGRLTDLGETQIAVHDERAAEGGWERGDRVDVRFADTGVQSFELSVLYTESDLAGNFVLGYPAFEANFTEILDFQIYMKTDPGVPVEEARQAIEAAAEGFPTATVQDLTEFKEAQASQINQLLGLVYALLGLSVIIAVIGIANTLALSIVERTHELGLLRAVGLTRRQLRAAIRWESIIIALLGAVLGLSVGVFFGWAVVSALRDEGFTNLVVPPLQLFVVAVLAALVGVAAAVGPARRAGKLDVLRAISAE